MTGKHDSLPSLLATPSSPPWTLERLFELTRRPSRAASHLVPSRTTENQIHHQVCQAKRAGPRTTSITTNANLECACAFVENALVLLFQKFDGPKPPCSPPALSQHKPSQNSYINPTLLPNHKNVSTKMCCHEKGIFLMLILLSHSKREPKTLKLFYSKMAFACMWYF